MFLKCKKEDITKAVSRAGKIISKNLALPALQGLELKTEKGEVYIRSTNLDLSFETKIPAKIEKTGSVLIPADILNNFLSNLVSEESVQLKLEGNNILVSSDDYNISIKTLPKSDFPTISKIKTKNTTKINTNDFIKGLRSVWFSASTSNIKPELSSVYIRKEDGRMVFVSTDSFRLSEKKIQVNEKKTFDEILIPQKNINEIVKVLEGIEEEIEVFFDKNQIAFKNKEIYLLSRIIDGTFPDYRQIIPKEFNTEVVLLKEEFLNSLKLSNIFSNKFNQTLLEVKNKKFYIKTENSTVGSSSIKLEGEIKGKDVSVNFNHKYIIDCFQSINSENIKLSLVGPGKPMLIEGVSDNSYSYIVMPMNK